MTDRIKGLSVTLVPNLRDDDAAPIIAAIQLLKGVVDVRLHVADSNHHFAVQQARYAMQKKIGDILWKED